MRWPGEGGTSVPPGFPGGESPPPPSPTPDPGPSSARRFGRRRRKPEAPEEPLQLQASYDDETVEAALEVIDVTCTLVERADVEEEEEDEDPEDDDVVNPFHYEDAYADADDLGETEADREARRAARALADIEPPEPDEPVVADDEDPEDVPVEPDDDEPEELDEPEEKRPRRPRLTVIWPGEAGSSVPPGFPGSEDFVPALRVPAQATRSREPRGLRAIVAAVYAALADPLAGGDEAAREQRALRVRKAGVVTGSAVLAAVLVYTIFPVRTYLDQRAATKKAQEEIDILKIGRAHV